MVHIGYRAAKYCIKRKFHGAKNQRGGEVAERDSSVAAASLFQIGSIQSRCSGFISTERRAVKVSRSLGIWLPMPWKKATGSSATARCKSCLAAAAKIFRDSADISPMLAARGANATMSNSGTKPGTN